VESPRLAAWNFAGGPVGSFTSLLKCGWDSPPVYPGLYHTWRDYLLNNSSSHTWMVYIPGLPNDLDYLEIMGLNAPNPVLVLNNHEDQLFTVPEMERADHIVSDVYRKAGAPDRYRMKFYPGPHKFDRDMQAEAFQWFDRWLK
jgi:hypothetical protein